MAGSTRKRVALIFGGRSSEHKVSLTSALGILTNINQTKYDLLPVKITTQGRWLLLDDPDILKSVNDLQKDKGTPVVIADPLSGGFLALNSEDKPLSGKQSSSIVPVDVVFPILHGTFGEDGTIQGLLRMADLPFVGAGVLASSLAMDKIVTKQMLFQNDIPSIDFLWFLRKEWRESSDTVCRSVEDEIGFPCFVKPANSGSSVGISKANNQREFVKFVDEACFFDRKIMVEKALDAREFECGVLGNDDPKASVVGEIVSCNEFYDYEAKYIDDSTELIVPADIPDEISEIIRNLSVKVFKILDCSGMGRVDFLFDKKSSQVYVSEINTIPGFTPISMYPKLWEATGISFTELIDKLISIAIERHEDLNSSKFQKD